MSAKNTAKANKKAADLIRKKLRTAKTLMECRKLLGETKFESLKREIRLEMKKLISVILKSDLPLSDYERLISTVDGIIELIPMVERKIAEILRPILRRAKTVEECRKILNHARGRIREQTQAKADSIAKAKIDSFTNTNECLAFLRETDQYLSKELKNLILNKAVSVANSIDDCMMIKDANWDSDSIALNKAMSLCKNTDDWKRVFQKTVRGMQASHACIRGLAEFLRKSRAAKA